MTQIDIVIPYVDGATPGYEELSRRYTGEFVPCHLRALGELRYTLRSIAAHAPWAEVMLVVQDAAHVPDWIDRARLRVAQHRDFLPEAHLPTFHAATISAHLFRIPGLADRYVIWEDDTLVMRDVAADRFFDSRGAARYDVPYWPILPGLERFFGPYQRNLSESRALVRRMSGTTTSCFLYPHMPLPVEKARWGEFYDRFIQDAVFRDTITRRSRGDEARRPTIDPLVTFPNWIACEKQGLTSLQRYGAALTGLLARKDAPAFGAYPVVNDDARMARNMRALLKARPLFANVNDEAYDDWPGGSDTLNPASQRLLIETLESLFPNPSRYER